MRKIICFLLCIITLFSILPSFAEEIGLYLNGNAVLCDPSPRIINDRTFIPLRALFTDMGAEVSWNGESRTVEVKYNGTEIKMTIDDKTAIVNNTAVGLSDAPLIINDRTFIPLRFVSEAVGLSVSWDGEKRRVDVYCDEKSDETDDRDETDDSDDEEEKTDEPRAILEDVEFVKRDDYDALSFSVSGAYELKRMTLKNPVREVFDIYGAVLSDKSKSFEGNACSVRFGVHDGYVRIVAEGEEPLRYLYADNGGVVALRIYPEKENFDFVGTDEKRFIFPEGAVLSASASDESVKVTASGVSLSNETVKLNDSLVSKVKISDKNVTVTLKSTASVKTEGNVLILTEEKKKEDFSDAASSRLVVLDAGHGGSDPGSLGKDESGEKIIAYEKDMNLSITLMVRDILSENGIETALTRSDDTYVGLAERTDFANERNAALFVSVHNNSIPDSEYKGSMVLFYMSSEKGRELAKNILDEMVEAAGTIDRGLRDGTNMAVIKRTDMPAVIVECGCLTNSEELSNLMDESFRKKLAEGIAEGIIKTLDNM